MVPALSNRISYSKGIDNREGRTADSQHDFLNAKIGKENPTIHGGALGPGWAVKTEFSTKMLRKNNDEDTSACPIKVKCSCRLLQKKLLRSFCDILLLLQIHFNESVVGVRNESPGCEDFPLYIKTTSGKVRICCVNGLLIHCRLTFLFLMLEYRLRFCNFSDRC